VSYTADTINNKHIRACKQQSMCTQQNKCARVCMWLINVSLHVREASEVTGRLIGSARRRRLQHRDRQQRGLPGRNSLLFAFVCVRRSPPEPEYCLHNNKTLTIKRLEVTVIVSDVVHEAAALHRGSFFASRSRLCLGSPLPRSCLCLDRHGSGLRH